MGDCIITRTDFGGNQIPDERDKDGPGNVGLLTIQPTDAAASPRKIMLR
jgi:hypothetical protein